MNSSRDDEHTEAFRRGFERARHGEEPTVALDDLMGQREEPVPDAPPATETAMPVSSPPRPQPADEEQRRPPTAAVLLGVLAFVLIAGAFGIGRLFADNASEQSGGASTGSSGQTGAYDGRVDAVRITDSMASCQTDSSVDAAGNTVTYEPAKAHDSDLSTAWRCNGNGVGQRFTVSLPKGTTVAEVGMVPGYAKTDPASGVDRYAENNRITKVRWTFDDGKSYVQEMSANPSDRSMRTMRIPETSTSRVVIEILASRPGPRNTVAISELRIGTPAG